MVPRRWKVLPGSEAQPPPNRQVKTEEGLEIEVKVEEEEEEDEDEGLEETMEMYRVHSTNTNIPPRTKVLLNQEEEWQEWPEEMPQEEEDLEEEALEDETREGGHVPTTTAPSLNGPFKANNAAPSSVSVSDTASETDAPLVVRKDWRKVLPFTFSRQQEGELVEWYRQNTILYDKEHEDYRMREKKNKLFQEKAKEYPDCTYDQLCQWIKNQRTIYGKLTTMATKTGTAGKKFTKRQQWIHDKWSFMKPHIVRVERRRSCKKFQKLNPPPSAPHALVEDPFQGASTTSSGLKPIGPIVPNWAPRLLMPALSSTSPSTSQQHFQRRMAHESHSGASSPDVTNEDGEGERNELFRILIEQAKDATRAFHEDPKTKSPQEDYVKSLTSFIGSLINCTPDNRMLTFTRGLLNYVLDFCEQSEQLMPQVGRQQMPPRQMFPMEQPSQYYEQKGAREKTGNYRPVSLTSVVGKMLESIIKEQSMMGHPPHMRMGAQPHLQADQVYNLKNKIVSLDCPLIICQSQLVKMIKFTLLFIMFMCFKNSS
ncbi:uncharacterized protein LOC129694707 isoform X3 [Leucoraja erinacea]|uniref:uncharacterized protein LOC129694707 isoform X3 n=1 Tax=Leucoraja erinaceus TaxID=7782 RepID=UPI002458B42D|nr:uncharacterized protein LOC129694707 isoform X3 [Leucoraja erinacea]